MTEKINITPVILCGGSGTRLWPLSRQSYPKQFLEILDEKSLFQESVERIIKLENDFIKINEIIIVTNEEHRFLVLHQIEKYKKISFRIILEPEPRNTAPALTLAALASLQNDRKTILVAMPADHFFGSYLNFKKVICAAINSAQKDNIVILGIKPSNSNTNYGYINFKGTGLIKRVKNFIEKPSKIDAEEMIKKRNCAWNAGFFILSPEIWIDSIISCNIEIFKNINKSWKKLKSDNWFLRPNQKYFKLSPSLSIDYAVMEKSSMLNYPLNIVLFNSKWSDLGSYEALSENKLKKSNNNRILGNVIVTGSEENIAIATKKNISLVGVKNLIVVETADSVLVASRDKINTINHLLYKIQKKQSSLLFEHTRVNRPWGWFETLDDGPHYKVKKILVKPLSKLSYQSHNYRSEHWIVLKGKATILRDKEELILIKNESTFIGKGIKHQLINNEKVDLEIIEIQTGNKISEHDIKRFEDIYGRI